MSERDSSQVALRQLSFWSGGGGGGQRVTGTGTWTTTGADTYAATTQAQVQREHRAEQAAELARVSKSISSTVLEFCRAHIGRPFHAEQLREYVVERTAKAPASPDRILRDLRQRGVVVYTVERAKSRYVVTAVSEEGAAA